MSTQYPSLIDAVAAAAAAAMGVRLLAKVLYWKRHFFPLQVEEPSPQSSRTNVWSAALESGA